MRKNIIKSLVAYLSVFLLVFFIFYFIQFSFSDIAGGDDGYRHIKQAWLIRTQGIEKAVRGFSWLECSILKDHPGDPWFGFHLLLYPFTFGDLTFGAKLSSVFLAASLFLAFFWLLRRFRVRYAFFWTLSLLFMTDYFNQRLLLPRAYILSILFSLVGFYLIFKKKYLWIFIISFLYGLITVESPLIIFIALAFTVLEGLREKKVDFKPLISTIFGVLAGLVIRPDFPNSFYLIYHSIFSVLSLRFLGVNLNFGGEISVPFLGSVKDNIFLFLALTLPFYWMIFKVIQKKSKDVPLLHLSLFFLSFFFAALTFLVGSRFVEYLVPFSTLLLAVWFNSWLVPKVSEVIRDVEEFKGQNLVFFSEKVGRFYRTVYSGLRFFIFEFKKKFTKSLAWGLFLFFFGYILTFRLMGLSLGLLDGRFLTLEIYKEAALWLRENTPTDSLVLNDNWSIFPVLFFYNHHNHYCNGMDPTFMYVKDPKTYWSWQNLISQGIICEQEKCDKEEEKTAAEKEEQIYVFLKEKLNGDYLFLSSQNKEKELVGLLSSSERFAKVFKKGIIEIYRIE